MLGRYPGFSFPRGWHLESMSEVYAANLSDCLVEVSLQNPYYLRAENVIAAKKTADIC